MVVRLRDHQVEAVDAVVRGLDVPPGGVIPGDGLRGQVHMACGTGKTFVAASAALRLAPRGRVLVLVPTLALLTQTVAAWQEAGVVGPSVAVCSLQDDPELGFMGVRCTTSAPQLALWHGSGAVTIYATYSSLPVLAEAFAGVYGVRLDAVDLVCVDEAHRTSGSLGKMWADVHRQAVIPAARRLYLTATPRIWEPRPVREVLEGARDPLPREMAASMDDEALFGPVIFRLSLAQGVARGLLARYQVIVAELFDDEVTPEVLQGELRHEEEVRGKRLAALQAAMLRTMSDHGLQTMITFHHRTVEAEGFAEGLPGVARRLHAVDPAKYPQEIWAGWLKGDHDSTRRQKVLGTFARRAGRAVLSNCRVLGEGVDIRAVDSVAILDPKGAPHDIVQAIGRALRQKPGQGKLASLIVPVFRSRGEEPEDMFTSASYRPLVSVLQALRAHDAEAVEMLAIPQENQTRDVNPSGTIGIAPEEGEEESRFLLRFAVPRDPAMVAQWVQFNVIDTERQDWMRGFAAARRYRLRMGHLLVPYGHREAPADAGGAGIEESRSYPLGQWISDQRKFYDAGVMTGKRVAALEQLGMVWDVADAAWAENLAAITAWYELHGTLAAPRSATALDKSVGMLLANLRRPGVLDKYPRRAEALAALDEDWNPPWALDWQRKWAAARQLVDAGVPLADITPGTTISGEDIGRWLKRQSAPHTWNKLTDGQRERLTRIGVQAPADLQIATTATAQTPAGTGMRDGVPSPQPGKTPQGASGAYARGISALRQYVAREGHVRVPRAHIEVLATESAEGPAGEGTPVKLGVWLSNTKARRRQLREEQRTELANLGVVLAQT
jgi:superfamily II DNA or RNA helicase